MKTRLKPLLAVLIVLATIGAFVYYGAHHPTILASLRHVPPLTFLTLLALDAVGFIALILVTRASLHMYRKTLGAQENLLFNAYSALVNFFGPGQSGPIFRGAYLKKRHGLRLKQFLFATLLYYAFYGVISIFCMFVGSAPWWVTVLGVTVGTAGSWWIIRRYKRRAKVGDSAHVTLVNLGLLFGATVLQVGAQVLVYAIELHNVGNHASLGQILAYTGVANVAIFVALTPGAIGIRESFLVFSQQLHHITGSTIVAANILDRGVYLAFLGMLFILVLSLHAKKKLQVDSSTTDA